MLLRYRNFKIINFPFAVAVPVLLLAPENDTLLFLYLVAVSGAYSQLPEHISSDARF